jgi:hypothetical protein
VPPLVGVAVKVMEEPSQMSPEPERLMLTAVEAFAVTVTVITSQGEYVVLHAPVPILRTQ